MEFSIRRRLGLLLALLSAAVTGILAAVAHLDAPTILWRCAVCFAAIWIYQRLLQELWATFAGSPAARTSPTRKG